MESRVNLEKLVKVILLSSIAIVTGFILYQVLFTKSPAYINFGMLNENGQYGNYPNNVSIHEEFKLRYYIGNYNPEIKEFSVRTYLANYSISTVTFAHGVENGNLLGVYYHTLNFNATYTSDPLTFAINETGDYYRICFELWVLNNTVWNYMESSVQYIWINCTL